MDESKEMRAKSNRFALILTLQVAFCALVGVVYSQVFQKPFAPYVCYALIFVVPLGYNLKWFLTQKKKNDTVGMHYALITEILVLIFVFQFLV